MKTMRFTFCAFAALLIGMMTVGCNHPAQHSDADEETGVSFSEGKGLSIPRETAEFIGLKVVDVGEQSIPAVLEFNARIYRPASAQSQKALASCLLGNGEAAFLNVGQTVKLESENGEPLQGRVVALNRGFEKTHGQIEALLEIEGAPVSLGIGSHLNASVPLSGDEKVIAIPKDALLKTAEGTFVYTVSGNHFVRSEVKLGRVSGEFASIADGLYAGDQVVSSPVMTLWMAELQSIRGGQACADGH